jgi:hypothetical protein
MDTIYIFLIFAIGIILAIGVGLEISKGIDEFIIYVLFWFLYIITIITFINIVLVGNYYITMRNKTGQPGQQGPRGDQGDKGQSGLCDKGCRDSICENAITELLTKELQDRNNGVRIDINNIYIKSKIKQMCDSDEFKQLAPYNGPINLINYLKDIWKIWIEKLFDSGGMLYFQTIGAEDQFDWLSTNPFDEIMKYDVFYWGMGKQYRPQILEKCYASKDGENPNPNATGSIIQVATTDLYDFIITDDNSQAYNHASFWRAKQFTYKTAVFYPVGDIIMGPVRNSEWINFQKHVGAITFPHNSYGPARETILISGDIKGPVNYELLWTNNGWTVSGQAQPNFFWVWRPIAPVDYIALGDVITTTADPPLTGDSAPIRCVPFDMVIKAPANGNVLWSSNGSRVNINLNMLGFAPNNGSYQGANTGNIYNLFRGVIGWNTSIPESDINGNFYYLDTTKYDATFQLGVDYGRPANDTDANRIGKGIIPSAQRDSKYSVIAYMNLKNNPVLTHKQSTFKINGQIIPNAISNTYIFKNGNLCIDYIDNVLTLKPCDELVDTQYFSIIFTGNMKNECTLKHYKTGHILKYKAGLFTLVDTNVIDDKQFTLFIMA